MNLSLRTVRCLALVCLSLFWAAALSAQSITPAPSPTTGAPLQGDEVKAPCDRYGLSTVIGCMGHDLRAIVKTPSRHWLEIGAVIGAGSLLLDDEVKKSRFEPETDRATKIAEHIGSASWQFGVPAATYFLGRATGHGQVADLSIALVRAQVVNAIFTRGLKLLPRPRPYETEATPLKGSFPSGHTSAAFATATVLQRKWGWKAGVPAYVVATYVGVTRLQNAHYLSDVTFGAALGVASGLAINPPGRAPGVTPIIAPGTVGLSFTIGGSVPTNARTR